MSHCHGLSPCLDESGSVVVECVVSMVPDGQDIGNFPQVGKKRGTSRHYVKTLYPLFVAPEDRKIRAK